MSVFYPSPDLLPLFMIFSKGMVHMICFAFGSSLWGEKKQPWNWVFVWLLKCIPEHDMRHIYMYGVDRGSNLNP